MYLFGKFLSLSNNVEDLEVSRKTLMLEIPKKKNYTFDFEY